MAIVFYYTQRALQLRDLSTAWQKLDSELSWHDSEPKSRALLEPETVTAWSAAPGGGLA